MEEKTIWRILAVGLLLTSIVYGQMTAMDKEGAIAQLKGIVRTVDTKSATTDDDQLNIATQSFQQMESSIEILDFRKCVEGCRALLPQAPTTTLKNRCGADRIDCGMELCCKLNEECKENKECVPRL
jgi:hypothetical protein